MAPCWSMVRCAESMPGGCSGLIPLPRCGGEGRLSQRMHLRAPAAVPASVPAAVLRLEVINPHPEVINPHASPLLPLQARVLHDAAVTALAPRPAATSLASASADGTLRLWDTAQLLTCTAQLGSGGVGTALAAAAWAGPDLLAAAGDAGISLWDVRQSGAAAAAAAALGARALSLAATAGAGGQQLLVAGDALGRVSVFDARSLAQPLQQRALHGDAVHALAAAAAPGGSGSAPVASGSDDGSILLLDTANLAASRQLVPAKQDGEVPCYVRAMAWSSGAQQQLWCGGWDQTIASVPL